jgi:hypothetical protein
MLVRKKEVFISFNNKMENGESKDNLGLNFAQSWYVLDWKHVSYTLWDKIT